MQMARESVDSLLSPVAVRLSTHPSPDAHGPAHGTQGPREPRQQSMCQAVARSQMRLVVQVTCFAKGSQCMFPRGSCLRFGPRTRAARARSDDSLAAARPPLRTSVLTRPLHSPRHEGAPRARTFLLDTHRRGVDHSSLTTPPCPSTRAYSHGHFVDAARFLALLELRRKRPRAAIAHLPNRLVRILVHQCGSGRALLPAKERDAEDDHERT